MATGYASKWRCSLAVATMALMAGGAAGQGASAPWGHAASGPEQDFDWMAHTQATLATLRGLLHLDADQAGAWDRWSEGVLKDAHRELEHKTAPMMSPTKGNTAFDESTPQQMARGIAHLRKHLAWMQTHLVELEAAQTRTQAFYEALDIKQKTVFDLYWHEVHHRVSGDDGDGDMQGSRHGGDGMGASMHGADHAERESMMPPHGESPGTERAP